MFDRDGGQIACKRTFVRDIGVDQDSAIVVSVGVVQGRSSDGQRCVRSVWPSRYKQHGPLDHFTHQYPCGWGFVRRQNAARDRVTPLNTLDLLEYGPLQVGRKA